MKSVLLRLAYRINRKYGVVIVNKDDFIMFNGEYFAITEVKFTSEVECLDLLEIEAVGINRKLGGE